jgi:FG-GAP-like repeat/Secretion system C-terminal sorting domain
MKKNVILVVCLMMLVPSLLIAQEWIEHIVADDFGNPQSVYATDVDGDGDIDFVVSAWQDNPVTWWENVNGTGLVWTEHIIDDQWGRLPSVYASDVDGDGDTDVLAADKVPGSISWWENVNGIGTEWTEHIVVNEFLNAQSVFAADVDGDGDIDVLGASWYDAITWWENVTGIGTTWTEHNVSVSFDGAHYVYATDMDGDGDIDILGAAFFEDHVVWWENVDGTGTAWNSHVAGDGKDSVYAMDIDGDGDTDILGGGGNLNWWENVNGTGTELTEQTINNESHISVYATDIDGDGDIDVIGAQTRNGPVRWCENTDGTGDTWVEHMIDSEGYGRCVNAADVDGDGDDDVLLVSGVQPQIVWYEYTVSPDPGVVTLTPANDPVIVSPGESFEYSVDIELAANDPIYGRIWTEVILPNGNTYGPLWTLRFYFGTTIDIHVEGVIQQIPLFAPLGEYEFVLNIGYNSIMPPFSDSFPFTVVEADVRVASMSDQGWASYGHQRLVSSVDADNNASLLTDYALQLVYPNPFNPTTTISVSLPDAAELTVVVYNVSGKRVAQLARGHHPAGRHSFVFDASGLASGLYFVNTTVPGHLNNTQKIMLVR